MTLSPEEYCLAPHTACGPNGAEILTRTLTAIEKVDNALADLVSRGVDPSYDDPLRHLRQRIKVSDDGDYEEIRWWSGLPLSEMEMFQETFIGQVEAERVRKPYSPCMPSLFNPVREDAPPMSWMYLYNPFSCKDWVVQRPLQSIKPRSKLCVFPFPKY